MSNDGCLENKREEYQNSAMLYSVPQVRATVGTQVRTVLTYDCTFRVWLNFCIFLLTTASLFMWRLIFLHILLLCVLLSVPEPLTAWTHSSPVHFRNEIPVFLRPCRGNSLHFNSNGRFWNFQTRSISIRFFEKNLDFEYRFDFYFSAYETLATHARGPWRTLTSVMWSVFRTLLGL